MSQPTSRAREAPQKLHGKGNDSGASGVLCERAQIAQGHVPLALHLNTTKVIIHSDKLSGQQASVMLSRCVNYSAAKSPVGREREEG